MWTEGQIDMTKLIIIFRNFAIALKMLDIRSEKSLQSQRCERNSVMFPILRRQEMVYVCTKKIVPFSSNNYFCSPEYSSFSK